MSLNAIRMMRLMLILGLICGGAMAMPVSAPDRSLPDASAEARAVAIMRELRCMVCQSQSVADSDAPLAADMRRLVRTEVASGKDREAIKEELVARYGDAVLMMPPVQGQTLLLWLTPVLLLGGGGLMLYDFFRKRSA